MTASERQKLERERNNRARAAVTSLSNYIGSTQAEIDSAYDSAQEMKNKLFILAKWAAEGRSIDWVTLDAAAKSRIAKILESLAIQSPFCSYCGENLDDERHDCIQARS